MKFIYIVFVLSAYLTFAGNAYAESGYALAQKHMCTLCHSLDRKLIGPTWMNVSLKYQNRPDAEIYLIGKIRSGGTGTWGSAVMPPSKQLSDADIKILAQYVLKLAVE